MVVSDRAPAAGVLEADGATELPAGKPAPARVNWLFTGVCLGAGSWLLVLSVVFAAFGNWIVAAALFAGLLLCLLFVWRAGRRAAAENRSHSALLG